MFDQDLIKGRLDARQLTYKYNVSTLAHVRAVSGLGCG